MRIDPTTFIVLTAALAACRDPEIARPIGKPAAPAPSSTAPTPTAYVDGLRAAGVCEEQRRGPRPPRTEGDPMILDPLARECDPLEHTGLPVSCQEGAFGCTTLVNTMNDDAARRVLACLRAKEGTAICARGVVAECALTAIAPTVARADVSTMCRAIADTCSKSAKTLELASCERFVASMRKCHGVERALLCLPDKCDLRACLDDWISTWSY